MVRMAEQRVAPRLQVTVATPDAPVAASRGLGPWLAGAAPARARGEVSLAVVSDTRMRTLNRAFRGQDRATDVLSFPAAADGASRSNAKRGSGGTAQDGEAPAWTSGGPRSASPPLGDIVIAVGVAQRQAEEAGHPLRTELRILALHGLLHLLGHDHDQDAGEMARVEGRLRRKAGLPASLIERHLPSSTARRPRLRDGPASRRGDPQR